MVTTMRILGWKAEGLRCPDHEISCCSALDQTFAVSLVQMPNGTGKTTTLSLLRAALSGAGRGWKTAEVREMGKRGALEGLFELRLAVNESRITIVMRFDFEAGRVDYRTTRGSGQQDGFNPPQELTRFMNPQFVNFYVFDGELADNLLDRNQTDADKAVENLFQVHLLRGMVEKVSEYWDVYTRDRTAKDQAGLTRRRRRLDTWRKRLVALETEKGKLETELENVLSDLERQQSRYDSELKKEDHRETAINDAARRAQGLTQRVTESARSVLDGMRDPHALSPVFARAMSDLKSGLDRVKLPESVAREFFEELSKEEKCVCGRPIGDGDRAAIRDRAAQYLGSDDVSLLNTIKSSVADAVGLSPTQPADELTSKTGELSELVKNRRNAENELDKLKREAEEADPKVQEAAREIERLKVQRLDLERKLKLFDKKGGKLRIDQLPPPESVSSIEQVEQVVSQLEKRVAEITDTLTQKEKRDVLKKIIDRAYRKAKQSISDEIRNETNGRIEALMPYNAISIDRIDKALLLGGKTTGSVGENLSIGYAFLATLFNRAGQHQLPFVVDSPANPIDLEVRARFGELVPKLTGQFIAFMISSEREEFLASLKQASPSDIQYLTLFRKGASHLENKAERHPRCTMTQDGFLVEDEGFFNEFQQTEEG